MNFIFSGLFWGLILVLLGLSVILKSVFHIDIPLVKILMAIILIYWGITLLVGKTSHGSDDIIMFKNTKMNLNNGQNEKTILFGSGIIDLTDISLAEGRYDLDVNVIFGSGVIYIPEDIPAVIKVSVVFGEGRFPNGSSEVFGDETFKTENLDKNQPYLNLNMDVVFGSGVIITK